MHMTSEDLIELLQSITVPVSKINSLEDVIQDPLVKKRLLFAKDPVTSQRRLPLSPPPIMNSFIKEAGAASSRSPPALVSTTSDNIWSETGF